MRRTAFLIIGLIVGGMGSFSISGCGDKIEPGNTAGKKPAIVKAEIATARLEQQGSFHEAVGTVEARLSSTVSSKIMGTVTEVKVREGQPVRKGEVLVVLTQQQISANHQQASAALEEARRGVAAAQAAARAAQANERLTQSTLVRYRKLVSGQSASAQELDEIAQKAESANASVSQADSMLAAAKQRVAQAQAGLAGAEATSQDTILKAPYDALVTEKMVEPGDFAGPGKPLVRLEGSGGYRVAFVLEEANADAVTVGQRLSVRFPPLSDPPAEGTVETIMPSADAVTRSVEVRLTLPTIPKLRSGVFARVRVPVGTATMIQIPQGAIVTRGQLTGVFKVDAERIGRFRLVRTGRVFGGKVEILSGMSDGDRYVVSPGPQMADGFRVEEGA